MLDPLQRMLPVLINVFVFPLYLLASLVRKIFLNESEISPEADYQLHHQSDTSQSKASSS